MMIFKKLKINETLLMVLACSVVFILLFFIGERLGAKKTQFNIEEIDQRMYELNKAEKYQEAVIFANKYIYLFPDDLDLWIHQAMAYLNTKDCINALTNMYHVSVRVSESNPYYNFVNELWGGMKNECSKTSGK